MPKKEDISKCKRLFKVFSGWVLKLLGSRSKKRLWMSSFAASKFGTGHGQFAVCMHEHRTVNVTFCAHT